MAGARVIFNNWMRFIKEAPPYLREGTRRAFHEYPAMGITAGLAVVFVGVWSAQFAIRDRNPRAHYCDTYTVFRADSSSIEKLRPPEDYPPWWVAQNLNAKHFGSIVH